MEDFKQELSALVAATWPEVEVPTGDPDLDRGVYLAEHVETIPLERLKPPYAVIAIPDWPAGNWSQDDFNSEPVVEFYYVTASVKYGSNIRGKLEDLRDVLLPPPPTADPLRKGQVLGVMMISTSRSIPINDALIKRRSPLMGGMLSVRMLVGRPT